MNKLISHLLSLIKNYHQSKPEKTKSYFLFVQNLLIKKIQIFFFLLNFCLYISKFLKFFDFQIVAVIRHHIIAIDADELIKPNIRVVDTNA